MYKSVDNFMKNVKSRTSGEDEFHQAVHEVFHLFGNFYKTVQNTCMQEFQIAL